MPTTTTTKITTEKEGYDTLKSHLNTDGLANLTESLQLYIKFIEGKKAGKRKKPDIELTKHKVKTGIQEKVELGGNDPDVDNMYSMHIEYDENKQQYIVTYLYGKANLNGNVLARGKKFTWVVSAKKKAIWKALESDISKALAPVSATKIKEDVSKLRTGIANIDKSTRGYVSYAALVGTIGTSMAAMNMYDQENFMGTKPEAIIGAVPVYSIQYLERAKSDRKLKSRAIGDVFLAHQKGNKDILRLDLTLHGLYKFVYLWYLVGLQGEGSGQIKNVSATDIPVIPTNAGLSEAENKPHKVLNYEVHRTFPVITKNHILLNMYLQTIEWHQSVEDGKNVIKVHLLFRKYFPTGAYKVFNAKKDKEGNIIGGSGLELVEKFGGAKRWMEFAIDAVWKMMRMYGEIYGRMLIGDDGQEIHKIDQEAMSSMSKMVTSYSGKFLGIL